MRAVFGILGVIIIVIVMVFLLVGRGPSGDKEVARQINLTDYSNTSATVSHITDGHLNAEEEHRAIRVSINRNQRTIDILTGYDGMIEKTQTFTNTEPAFEEFLYGLKNAGYTKSQPAKYETEQGVCPTGRRYLYQLEEDSQALLSLWSTSCFKTDGNFAGNAGLVRRLFREQIPNYDEFTRGVKL